MLQAFLSRADISVLAGPALESLARTLSPAAGAYERFAAIEQGRRFLRRGDERTRRAAVVALAAAADERTLEFLRTLALDTEAARRFLPEECAPADLRAAACLGLARFARTNESVRAGVVRDLVSLLEDPATEEQLALTCLFALPAARLPRGDEQGACTCGACEIDEPWASLQGQVGYTARILADRERSPNLRAAATGALGRLLEDEIETEVGDIKADLIQLLAHTIEAGRRESDRVRESAVLALGRLADADEDPADRWARRLLQTRLRAGSHLERCFALMSLGRVAARPGSGNSGEGRDEIRGHLSFVLARGNADLRPWAALSLGVLGFEGRLAELELSEAIDRALEHGLQRARAADAGAFALALALREEHAAVPTLMRSLRTARTEEARSFAALALGLLAAPEAKDELSRLVLETDVDPALAERMGLALGLVADERVLASLRVALPRTVDSRASAAVVHAIGIAGSPLAIDALEALLEERAAPLASSWITLHALGNLAARESLPWRTSFTAGAHPGALPRSLSE